jgi:hypothetical protein
VRIAFCVSDAELKEGLERMVRLVERLRKASPAPAGAR